jgi:sulfur-carrier protein adenylyltransferase/sulfurtransferase
VRIPLDPAELARYQRHLHLAEIGATGQERLKAARVLIVGVGGLGCPAALYLAAAGVGTLGLIDGDCIDLSNLQRQILFSTEDIGRHKATVAREQLLALNPHTAITAYDYDINQTNVLDLIRPYDVIIDGSDRLRTRYIVNDACVMAQKPLISAAIHRFEGQLMSYIPKHGPCYRCLYSDAQQLHAPNCATTGVLGVLPGVLGTLQATETIKLLLKLGDPLVGRLLIYDALSLAFSEFRFTRRPDCRVCGPHADIKIPGDAILEVAAITISELRTQHASTILIDVREPSEFEAGHLQQAINIPLSMLEMRLREFNIERPLIFMCRSGVRSEQAGQLALRAGFKQIRHLRGDWQI